MNILFITKNDPFIGKSGDAVYTRGIISSISKVNGVQLSIYICNGHYSEQQFGKEKQYEQINKIHYGMAKRFPGIFSIFSLLPKVSLSTINKNDLIKLQKILGKESIDVVILNESATLNALKVVNKYQSKKTLYISHNVDFIIRKKIAKEVGFLNILKIPMLYDAEKYKKYEIKYFKEVELFTSITNSDYLEYKKLAPEKKGMVLKPGFENRRSSNDLISDSRPNNAILMGSFYWKAKQFNLLELIESYSKKQRNFNLIIAGSMSIKLYKYILNKYPEIKVIRNFSKVEEVLKICRIGLILEKKGGGFKLKALDYIFNNIPILGYKESMEGLELVEGVDYICAKNVDDANYLIEKVINDFDCLNNIQSNAFKKSAHSYSWSERASSLINFLKENN
ncbi:MAG: hypothetical protein CMP91_00400 [Gammaproteobacteria bacterium]|nr:hypothetical protein [Gammaproteobacteria bacterium]|tara:strand:- start:80613 stop:81797 length:1185 start_codon:yes stop_codon:yes gene_type:complete